MPSTVSSSTGTSGLHWVIRTFGLTTERTLINTALLRTRERQTHVLKLKHHLRAHLTHVFNGVLVTDVVRPLYSVVHMPTPIIIRVRTGNGTGNTTLSRYSV